MHACFSLAQRPTELWSKTFANQSEDEPLILEPGELVLIPTLEEFYLPPNVYATLQTRTSVAFLGLDVTPTHTIVPGFGGCLYMPVMNRTRSRIRVPGFFAIGEMSFYYTEGQFSGAGPEYLEAVKGLHQTSAPVTTSPVYSAVSPGINAVVTLGLVFGAIIVLGVVSAFVFGIPRADFGVYIKPLFFLGAVCALAAAYGKEIFSSVIGWLASTLTRKT